MTIYRILAINPGSTSTKIALYDNNDERVRESLPHSLEELRRFSRIEDQYEMRKAAVLTFLAAHQIPLTALSAVVGRGGLLPPVRAGAYRVNPAMVDCLRNHPVSEHASNLGALIAYDIAVPLGIPAYIYDSVAVDELQEVARISGWPELPRRSLIHALNMRAAAIRTARRLQRPYHETRLIVAHLGGGISMSAHQDGRMIDIISDDEGTFAPERAGRVPCIALAKLCFSGKYTQQEILKMFRGQGGCVAYLGTNDTQEVEARIQQGDPQAALIYQALAYQIAKGIGELATVLCGKVDRIVLTGGIAHSAMLTGWIRERVEWIAPIELLPGENELEALASGALRVLRGEETAREFVEEERFS
ncbi:probable butyrate kinase 1 [Candidatus Moduliflexus flocculans]|uniref:Probable butyrate kinase n=1 Tax=Candidatus Moduliflexus flocculans TaxID=1499966 RepID=A0A0S6VQG1_9BACT|nr:probable butyrate kinase 1 [Candidatus Moduliflexus flocculans]